MDPKPDDTATVVFQPSGRIGKVLQGTTIIEAARLLGAGIEALCGGHHACGKCKVRIETGSVRSQAIESRREHAGPWQAAETDHITSEEKAAGYRMVRGWAL